VSPLKQTFSTAIRMAIVLAFLLGLPLVAIPQISEHLQELLHAKPRELAANHQPSPLKAEQAASESDSGELGTTVTTLAADRLRPASIQPNLNDLAVTIEELKSQFVEAGVSYMVAGGKSERIRPSTSSGASCPWRRVPSTASGFKSSTMPRTRRCDGRGQNFNSAESRVANRLIWNGRRSSCARRSKPLGE